MAEEVKKSRPAPDPNSAKFKLGQIAAKAYSDAMEAKKRGEMVGWCASNFPVEIPETLGLYVCYPENQAAGIAARGGGERMCNEAPYPRFHISPHPPAQMAASRSQKKRTRYHTSFL